MLETTEEGWGHTETNGPGYVNPKNAFLWRMTRWRKEKRYKIKLRSRASVILFLLEKGVHVLLSSLPHVDYGFICCFQRPPPQKCFSSNEILI